MSACATEIVSPVIFSDSAAAKVKELVLEEGNPALKLRIFVSGGGCSGFQYGFTFDDAVADDDTIVEKNGVSLLVDPKSLAFIDGMELDFVREGLNEGFKFNNPNVKDECGCGESFNV